MNDIEIKKVKVITKVINDAAFMCEELVMAFKRVAINTKLNGKEVIEYGKERSKEKGKSSCRYSSGR